MKNRDLKTILIVLIFMAFSATHAQIVVKLGSALQQVPGTDVTLPVSVQGLNSATGGQGITALELHIAYNNTSLIYDTTLNFTPLMPAAQWFFNGNGLEYSTNWVEPLGGKLDIPDNTVLFNIVFHYTGGTTALTFDTTRCLLIDSAYNIISGVQYINGQVTPSQGSGESRWNGTGAWNTVANWSNGIPGDSTDAIIETGSVTIFSNATCKNLRILAGTIQEVGPNYSLTINKDLVNDGTLGVLSDETGTGSLIILGTATGTGVNRINRYLDLSGGMTRLVASPVTGAKATVFGGSTVERYSESTAAWNAMAASDNLEPGTGYRVSGTGTLTTLLEGGFTTGDLTLNNLSYTAASQPATSGLNMAGNPYPSAIQLEKGNWNRTNLDRAVYVWNGYRYVTWNGQIGGLKDGIVPAMQGFFVKSHASGASLKIPGDARLHSTMPYYKSVDEVPSVIRIRIRGVSDTLHLDETFVNILAGSTGGFDPSTDAWKLAGNILYPQIWTKASDQSVLSINTQPDLESIPVEVQTGSAGSYQIDFSGIESFISSQPVFFEDKTSSMVINLRNTPMYVFTSSGTTESGRFMLHFHEVGLGELADKGMAAWQSGQMIYYRIPGSAEQISNVELYHVSGRLVYQETNSEKQGFQVTNLSSGIYILKITTTWGVYTAKLYCR